VHLSLPRPRRSRRTSHSPSRARQLRLLRAEGIDASRGRVDLKRHGWGAPDGGDLDRWLWSRDGE